MEKHLSCPRLPLAVYREVVAHLRQVDGVSADLFPQTSQEFDYLQSQVGGISLSYPELPSTSAKVEAILNYYAGKYGSWLSSHQ
ncbi:MAG: hypothetical protein NZ901_11010 [Geminocystis sp.]|nr:hypothetical protein [Geminocystis sp.]MCS7148701.1 hypothetical protein [Geminocystis sp.]MDW8463509.1 hypothetical protein [Geminocystis sp.]